MNITNKSLKNIKNKQQIMKTVCRMIVVPPATMHERLIVFCGSRA